MYMHVEAELFRPPLKTTNKIALEYNYIYLDDKRRRRRMKRRKRRRKRRRRRGRWRRRKIIAYFMVLVPY